MKGFDSRQGPRYRFPVSTAGGLGAEGKSRSFSSKGPSVGIVALFILTSLPVLAEESPEPAPDLPDILVRDGNQISRGQAAAEAEHGETLRITPRRQSGDLLVEKAWLDANVPDLASDREYTVTSFEGQAWVTVDIRGRGHAPISFESFSPSSQRMFTHGSSSSVGLVERPMFVQVFTTHNIVTDPNGTVPDLFEPYLAIDFFDGDTTGQVLEYNAQWLEAMGLTDPFFAHEDGQPIPARLVNGSYEVHAQHFSSIYAFNTAEGFSREADRTYSHIWWVSASESVTIKQDKRDASDEIFSKAIPSPITYSQGGEVRTMHKVTTHGYHQSHIPLFLAKSGVTDINTGAGTAFFYYQGGASSSQAQLFMRIRAPSGTLLYDQAVAAPSGVERELSIHYIGSGTYVFSIADHSQQFYNTYQVQVAYDANLRYDKWGVATNGWSGAAETAQYATIDNMLLRYGGYSGSDDDPVCLNFGFDLGGYQCAKVAYAKQTMTGATSLSMSLDGMSSAITLPFSYNWYGATKTQVKISANGFLTFDTSLGSGHWVSHDVPNTATPNDMIACGWEDLDFTQYDGVTASTLKYGTYGTSPNRKFVVDYANVYHYYTRTSYLGAGNHFQIQLHENGDAYCMLGDVVDDTDGANMLIGIENAAGTIGTRYMYGEAGIRNVGVKFSKEPNENPYTPTNVSPFNGATGVALSPTLSWSSNGDPDGDDVVQYHVYLSSGGSYSHVCTQFHPTKECTLSGLLGATTYSWKVKATDGKGGEATSIPTSFATLSNTVTMSNPSPTDGATNVLTPVYLSWSANVPGGGWIRYWIYEKEGWETSYRQPMNLYSNTAENSLDFWNYGWGRGKTYNWYISAEKSDGTRSDSPVWTFSTKANGAPTADFTAFASGLTVNFDAAPPKSSDPEGDSLSYSWDFGDGGTSTSAAPTYTYVCLRDDGDPHSVTLTVTDSFGASSSPTTKSVIVTSPDSDGDGLIDCREAQQGTSKFIVDTDGDGLNDFVESKWYPNRHAIFCGGSAASPCPADKLPSPTVRDIFVEMDYMDSNYVMDSTRLAYVTTIFGAKNIRIHLDAGDIAPSPAYNLGGGDAVTYYDYIGTYCDDWSRFNTLKAVNFDSTRDGIFHYMIWAHSQAGTCEGSSGISNGVPAQDFTVTLGSWTDAGGVVLNHGTQNERLGTFLHELGHNLGLRHGGHEDRNFKPNYLSVMQYAFQWGIPTASSGTTFRFSAEVLPSLNEANLNEAVGLGPLAANFHTMWRCPDDTFVTSPASAGSNVNWNCNEILGQPVIENGVINNLNGDGNLDRNWNDPTCRPAAPPLIPFAATGSCEVLPSHNDWNGMEFRGILPGFHPGSSADEPTVSTPGHPDASMEDRDLIYEAWAKANLLEVLLSGQLE